MRPTVSRLGTSLVLSVLLVVSASSLVAEDWHQFRGPDRDGISKEEGLDFDWSDASPRELWRRSVGDGFASVTVVGDRAYTADSETTSGAEAAEGDAEPAGVEYALAVDARTGEEVWRVAIGEKTFTEFGHGPRATPTVAGDSVLYLGAEGTLWNLDRATGEKRWSVDLGEVFGSQRPRWGYSGSALVDGDMILLDVGGAEAGQSHAALALDSGKLLWTSGENGRGGRAGYSSVLEVQLAEQQAFVHLAGNTLRAVDREGTEHWSFDLPQGEAHSMPIFVPPNRIYASGATPVGAVMLEVDRQGEAYEVEEVWRTHLMRNHFSTSVYLDGFVYGFDNATLKCFDAETGKQKWAKRGLGKGSLIAADGHLVVLTDQGRLLVAPASPDGFTETGSIQALEGKSWTAPSLADGVLYLRNHTEMVAYDLRAGGDS